MKQHLLALGLGVTVSTGLFAATPQTVNVCISVNNNKAPTLFTATFRSTDYFDHGNSTTIIGSGKTCVSHRYSYGPKSLQIWVDTSEWSSVDLHAVLLVPGKGCPMKNNESWSVSSPYQETHGTTESYHVTLTQDKPVDMFKYVYAMECEHESS